MAGTNEVGRGGLEPPRPCGQQILSLSRLPFRHQPSYVFIIAKNMACRASYFSLGLKEL